MFCLQKPAGSPNGHRYLLGQYGGKRQKVLAALNKASAMSGVGHKDLQNLSWAIQAGVAYEDMPQEMQALVNKLIPDHRSALKRGWLEDIEKIWNTGSRILNLPSFESFLVNQLGEAGRGIVAFREVKNRLVSRGQDWRNLSNIFIINDGTRGVGDVLKTPWSNLNNGIHARFVTKGNYDDIGFLLTRVPNSAISSRQNTLVASVNFAKLPPNTGRLRVDELDNLIAGLVAVPEGNAPIQPFGMSSAAGGFLGKIPVRNGRIQIAAGPGLAALAPWLIEAMSWGGAGILTAKAVQDTQEILKNEEKKSEEEAPPENQKPADRTEPKNLEEQIALEEAKAGAGKEIMQGKIKDPNYPPSEWTKKSHAHKLPDGKYVEVHYWENKNTGHREGFKFK